MMQIFSSNRIHTKNKQIRLENKQRSEHNTIVLQTQQIVSSKKLQLDAIKDGIKEHIKKKVIAEETLKEKLQSLVNQEDNLLLKTKTYFPFDFFPDTVFIDTTKVAITKKRFFATERVTVIHFKDISEVEVETSLFLANLTITYVPRVESLMMPKPQIYKIRLLPRRDAIKAQQIIKGILIVRREGVDTTRLNASELDNIVAQLGESNVPI